MKIELRYVDDCPNWRATATQLDAVLEELGIDARVATHLVGTHEEAMDLGFRGSPTIVVDGSDLFDEPRAPIGLACRIYRTETGMAGSPTDDQLRAALADRG